MKTVLITGATSGIGREFAQVYSNEGFRLILTGRRTERLQEMKEKIGENCRILTADLSDEKQCMSLLDELKDEQIDIFINNAGFGASGNFMETDLEKEISMLKVNDLAMHILFKGILLKMKDAGSGTILNVASSAGLFPGGPYMAAYYASKSYVASLTRGVARELAESKSDIYVCCLCPGPVDTEFNENADVTFALKGITAKQCVKECLSGMKKRKTVIIPTFKMKAAVFSQRFATEKTVLRIVANQQKKKHS